MGKAKAPRRVGDNEALAVGTNGLTIELPTTTSTPMGAASSISAIRLFAPACKGIR